MLYWLGNFDSQKTRFLLEGARGPLQLDLGDLLYAPNLLKDDQVSAPFPLTHDAECEPQGRPSLNTPVPAAELWGSWSGMTSVRLHSRAVLRLAEIGWEGACVGSPQRGRLAKGSTPV